jgi:cell division protein FtsW (lipid II flippase)
MKKVFFGACALICLVVCAVLPVLVFLDKIEAKAFKDYFLIATAGWFIFAVVWTLLFSGKSKNILP